MSALEIFFLSCAIVGGVFFVLRAALFFYGVGADMDHGDFDMNGDAGDFHADGIDLHGDGNGFDASHGNTDVSFKFLSIQGISAFLTMFGLVGLAGMQSNWQTVITFIVSFIAGIITVFLIGLIFTLMQRLQSDGTVQISNALGKEGTVYLTIPAVGAGKVNIVVQGALREYSAISADQRKIVTGETVRVVKINADNILVVERVN